MSNKCPDCGVAPGQLHEETCDVERCPQCGRQALSCGCFDPTDKRRMAWTGEWPGVDQCRELGWYCKWILGRWTRCSDDDPDGTEDLNRLVSERRWDNERQKWVLR